MIFFLKLYICNIRIGDLPMNKNAEPVLFSLYVWLFFTTWKIESFEKCGYMIASPWSAIHRYTRSPPFRKFSFSPCLPQYHPLVIEFGNLLFTLSPGVGLSPPGKIHAAPQFNSVCWLQGLKAAQVASNHSHKGFILKWCIQWTGEYELQF